MPATNTRLPRLLFLLRPLTLLMEQTCRQYAQLSSLYYLDVYDYKFDHQMSLSKSKCWHSNNGLHFLKHTVPFRALNLVKFLVKNRRLSGTSSTTWISRGRKKFLWPSDRRFSSFKFTPSRPSLRSSRWVLPPVLRLFIDYNFADTQLWPWHLANSQLMIEVNINHNTLKLSFFRISFCNQYLYSQWVDILLHRLRDFLRKITFMIRFKIKLLLFHWRKW